MHKMRLVDFAFCKIKNKEKDIEIRLNDEKRKLLKVNDIIEFENIDTKETIKTRIINLYKFKTFNDLFDSFEHKRLGLKSSDDASIMNNFYSIADQEKYEALAIEIELIKEDL